MPTETLNLWSRARGRLMLLLPLALYAALVYPAASRHNEQINPDAVAYIRFAQYLQHGDTYHSVSGYWSPLISWCIVPLLSAGVDGLYAAHAVLAIWGAIFLLALRAFLARCTSIPALLQPVAMCAMAVATVSMATSVISPDLIMAACLMGYFAVAGSPRLLTNRKVALGAGLLGGLSFLAKAYALPFFLLHFPLTLLLHRRIGETAGTEKRPPFGSLLRPLTMGMIGCFILAGPWIGVLSSKYHAFTFSTTGSRAHAIVGPGANRAAPLDFGLADPPHITLKEVPEVLPYKFWSPLHSKAEFMHQLRIVKENGAIMLDAIGRFDWLWLSLGAVVLAPILAHRRITPGGEDRFRLLWLPATIAAYCSGFLLVFFEGRYIRAVLLPLCLVLCMQILVSLLRARPSQAASRGRATWAFILPLAVAISFAAAAIREPYSRSPRRADLLCALTTTDTSFYRDEADLLSKNGVRGPVASTDWSKGLYVAYHMGQPFIGFPRDADAARADALLRQYGTQILLVWPEKDSRDRSGAIRRCAEAVGQRPGWVHSSQRISRFLKGRLQTETVDVYFWQPEQPPATRRGTTRPGGEGPAAP